ncbi:TolC family protein [Legionella hackeliae]|uniref:Putative outer membrane efflux protein n=1 Tax=Legionella hackeliae TaxID=449 RepID=A0A0A8URV2_LEGHA|nr:TolC family protein [Legionella hackeliae]KTD13119.1 outer membrane efflux protein [Legionella hackeliae]CEK11570.1 putative outer membrane efflux protein [Legionella hackeliae]STX48343.1 outer membrane efflux protein [Legionella hackeliae]
MGILILGIAVSSCTHYSSPKLLIPAKWSVHNERYKETEVNLPCFPWWQQFKDPVLNQLVDEGLLSNNDIKIAVANIEAAQGELKRVKLNWIPDVTGNAGYSSFPALGFPGVLLTVVPSYTMNIFKQIKEQKKATYELIAVKAIHEGVRLAIIGEITRSYLSYVAQIEELQLLHTLENDLAKFANISQAMFSDGIFAQISVEQARTELHLTQAREKLIQQNIVISQNALRYLLDKNPGNLQQGRRFSQLNGQQMIVGSLPLCIIENRPDLQQAKQELKASSEGINIAFSNLLPTVQLSLARGEIATVPNGYHLGQSIHFNQAILEMPLLRASTFGKLAHAKGLNRASFYRYTDTLRKVLRDVNNALSAHELYSQRYDETLRAGRNLRRAYQLNDKLYQRGIISHLELIKERIKLDKLAIKLNEFKLEQFLAIINLYENLAAGYNYQPSVSVEIKKTTIKIVHVSNPP